MWELGDRLRRKKSPGKTWAWQFGVMAHGPWQHGWVGHQRLSSAAFVGRLAWSRWGPLRGWWVPVDLCSWELVQLVRAGARWVLGTGGRQRTWAGESPLLAF